MLTNYLLLGAALMALGMIGFLSRRNLIVMFLSAEMMLQGVALTLVAFGRFHGNWTGQVFTIVILTVAACEASIALALILDPVQSQVVARRVALAGHSARKAEPAIGRRRVGDAEPLRHGSDGPETYPHLLTAGVEPAHPTEAWMQPPRLIAPIDRATDRIPPRSDPEQRITMDVFVTERLARALSCRCWAGWWRRSAGGGSGQAVAHGRSWSGSASAFLVSLALLLPAPGRGSSRRRSSG